ncbi:unnamed protein product [Soboliphyme baturini]|uniref:Bestrophin homolog n=1 Tax=Soboliphyme baturini TaxID=241478 RepID=A0A183IU93_9BILA|nr:unnamed protein product [Soboliphyme baturini]
MTISYSRKVSSTKLGQFLWLLFRWKGSIYRLLYKELLIYIIAYYSLASLYRFGLKEKQKRVFEHVSLYFDKYAHSIPLTFVLGFYVSLIIGRWWKIFQSFAWPDK